jgi:hypothetical protein
MGLAVARRGRRVVRRGRNFIVADGEIKIDICLVMSLAAFENSRTNFLLFAPTVEDGRRGLFYRWAMSEGFAEFTRQTPLSRWKTGEGWYRYMDDIVLVKETGNQPMWKEGHARSLMRGTHHRTRLHDSFNGRTLQPCRKQKVVLLKGSTVVDRTGATYSMEGSIENRQKDALISTKVWLVDHLIAT